MSEAPGGRKLEPLPSRRFQEFCLPNSKSQCRGSRQWERVLPQHHAAGHSWLHPQCTCKWANRSAPQGSLHSPGLPRAVTALKRFAFAKVRVSIIQDSCFHAPCGHQRRTCHLSGHREDLKGGPPMRGSRDLVKAAERWTGHSWTSAGTSVSTRPARPQPTKASYRCVPGTLWQQLGCCHLQLASTGNGEKPSRRSASTRRRRAQATRNRRPTRARRRRLAGGRPPF